MDSWQRSRVCAELGRELVGEELRLNGWVKRIRHHGQLHFLDLRDASGIVQVVFDAQIAAQLHQQAGRLKMECCVAIAGEVRLRPEAMVNERLSSGEVEVLAHELIILGECDSLPFMIDDEQVSETLRQRYRYLALRGQGLQQQLRLRHRLRRSLADYLEEQNFVELETPTLLTSTPEGARDYLVPSRLHPGSFYALPQSPQLYKQLLMVAGFERYYQFARCYRDEDARGDRQPEFTQLDIELSFVNQEQILQLGEAMMRQAVRQCLGEAKEQQLPASFPRLSYYEAIDRYGSDKPDLRFGLELQDFSSVAAASSFKTFNEVLTTGGVVKALVLGDLAAEFSRKRIDELEQIARQAGAKGLAWCRLNSDGLSGGIARFLEAQLPQIRQQFALTEKQQALLLFVADKWPQACKVLGLLRSSLAVQLQLIDNQALAFAWVLDYPLFEWDEEAQHFQPAHHMFSAPQEGDIAKLEQNPGEVLGQLYDLVLNGYELGSGSIRIHQPELQRKIFDIIGMSSELANERFGFLLEALRYGPPPHGGIAFGLDRLAMIFCQRSSIKDVIAFPKNNAGVSLLDKSPSAVSAEQLEELSLCLMDKGDSTDV